MVLLRKIPWWVLAVACGCGLLLTFGAGAFAGGFDAREMCRMEGQVYDKAYRAEHWREPGRLFPLHNKCNAAFDLVPAWVNPTLVCLTVAAGACVTAGLVRGARRLLRDGDTLTMDQRSDVAHH